MRYLILCLLGGLLASCVDRITFDVENTENILVVNGVISNQPGPQQIRLFYSTSYGSQVFEPVRKASVHLSNNRNQSEQLREVEPGIYEWSGEVVRGEVGDTYELDIRLPDGRHLRSRQETMPPVPTIDSLYFDVKLVQFSNDFGNVLEKKLFQVWVQTTINDAEVPNFIRWDVEHVYSFEEPFLWYLPLRTPKTCYIYKELDPQIIRLLDGQAFSANTTISQQVAENTLDFSFSWLQSYRVFQYSLTKEAYDYWTDLNKISNQVGNIFDAPPAPVRGNMYYVDDPEELVLGYFGASAVAVQTLFVRKPDIGPDFLPSPYCGITPRNPDEKLNVGCINCMRLSNSSLERPSYW